MSQVLFTPRAEQDLEEIGDYIAADNPTRAQSFVQEIRTHCTKIAAAPLAYAGRPQLGEHIRTCLHGRYVIFFKAESGAPILIVRVLHGARDLSSLFPDQV